MIMTNNNNINNNNKNNNNENENEHENKNGQRTNTITHMGVVIEWAWCLANSIYDHIYGGRPSISDSAGSGIRETTYTKRWRRFISLVNINNRKYRFPLVKWCKIKGNFLSKINLLGLLLQIIFYLRCEDFPSIFLLANELVVARSVFLPPLTWLEYFLVENPTF